MQQLGDGASTDSSWGDSSADKEEGGSGEQQGVVNGRHSPSNSSTSSKSNSNMDMEKMEEEEVRGGKIAPSDDNPSSDDSGEASVSDDSNYYCVTGEGGNTNNGVHQTKAKKRWAQQGESEEARQKYFPPREEVFPRGSLSSALEYSASGLMEGAQISGVGDTCGNAAGTEKGRAVEELPAAGTVGNRAVRGQAKASDVTAALGDGSEDSAGDEDHGLADGERSTSELRGVDIMRTSARTGDCDPLRSSCDTAGDGGGGPPARPRICHYCTTSDALVAVGSFGTARRDRGSDSEK